MATFDDAKRDAADLAKLVNEDTDVTTRYGTNPKVSAPKAIRLIEASGTAAVNQIQTDAANAIATLNTSRGFRVVGDFASGFTYELPNDVAIDASGNYWAYADVNALPVTVTAGATPSSPTYTQVTFNQASAVTTTAGINAQQFIDNFELKIFQSPTDNLTKVSTFAGGVGVVYEVRKTSDNTLATIYSDKDSVNEIEQNGIVNVSDGDAEAVFYIADGDYKVTIDAVTAGLDVRSKKQIELTLAELSTSLLSVGTTVAVTDRSGADFKVVSGGSPNGYDVLDAGGGNTAELQLKDGIIYADWFGVKKDVDTTTEITALRDFMAANDNAKKYTLVFKAGTYIYTTSPNWAIKNLTAKALGVVTFRNIGTGNCIIFDDPIGTTYNITWCWDNPMRIEGDDNTGHGFYHRSIHHSKVALNIRGCGLNVQRSEFSVVNEFFIISSINEGPFYSTTKPAGISLSSRNPGEETSANTWYNPIIEGMRSVGIFVDEALNNKFINGTSEGNQGANIECSINSKNNQFYGTDLEVTTSGQGFIDRGRYNKWVDIFNDANSTITSTAVKTKIVGGILSGITNQGTYTSIIDVTYGADGSELTDTGTFTTIKDAYDIESASVKVRNKTLGVLDAVTRTVTVGAFAVPSTVPGRVTKVAIPISGIKTGESVTVTAVTQEPEEFTPPVARCVVDGQIEISLTQLYGAAVSPFPSGSDFIVKFGN